MKATSTSEPCPPALRKSLPCITQETAFMENYAVGQRAASCSCMQCVKRAAKKKCMSNMSDEIIKVVF